MIAPILLYYAVIVILQFYYLELKGKNQHFDEDQRNSNGILNNEVKHQGLAAKYLKILNEYIKCQSCHVLSYLLNY